eukprot:g8700.t1
MLQDPEDRHVVLKHEGEWFPPTSSFLHKTHFFSCILLQSEVFVFRSLVALMLFLFVFPLIHDRYKFSWKDFVAPVQKWHSLCVKEISS